MSSLRLLLPRSSQLLRSTRFIPSGPSKRFSTTPKPLSSTPQDPYPLPLSNPDLAALASRSPRHESSTPEDQLPGGDEEWPMPAPLDRTGESLETLRARLVYQTRKRGTLETDLILATFARDFLGGMGLEEMKEFDKLLDEPDWDIYYWSVQKKEPPARWAGTPLLKKLQQHARNEGREVRMMPALMQRAPEKL